MIKELKDFCLRKRNRVIDCVELRFRVIRGLKNFVEIRLNLFLRCNDDKRSHCYGAAGSNSTSK
jgi:hypothetical protein